jgi:thymidylate synthase (FAD)
VKIVKPSVTLESSTEHPAEVIERAGRTCYQSGDRIEPGSAGRFVKMLLGRGHLSVLEHVSATLRIVCDRGVSHELVRHRIASYSQESTRYVAYRDEIEVIAPPDLDSVAFVLWHRAMEDAERSYQAMLENHCKPEMARSVLPTCLKTELVMTANAREWMHVLEMREAPAAHPQMREVAGMMRQCLAAWLPEVFPRG